MNKVTMLVCVAAAMILAMGVADADGADAAKPTVEVRGLRIVGKGYGKTKYGPELRAFNWSPGVAIAVFVKSPEGGLLELDRKASTLKKLADDKGTDLLKASKSSAFGQRGFGMSTNISKDGKACMLELVSKAVPAKGATEIVASGTMIFKCATTKKTFTDKNVALEAGSKIEAGAIPFEITKAGKPKWGDAPLEITLKTNTEMSRIAAIKFFDAAGKEIPSKSAGGSTMRMGDQVTIEKNFRLEKRAATATVSIVYWTDMKKLEVPFDIKATLGL